MCTKSQRKLWWCKYNQPDCNIWDMGLAWSEMGRLKDWKNWEKSGRKMAISDPFSEYQNLVFQYLFWVLGRLTSGGLKCGCLPSAVWPFGHLPFQTFALAAVCPSGCLVYDILPFRVSKSNMILHWAWNITPIWTWSPFGTWPLNGSWPSYGTWPPYGTWLPPCGGDVRVDPRAVVNCGRNVVW